MSKLKVKDVMPFEKENYMLLGISAAVMIIGYLLMVGGATEDPAVFDPDKLFSFRRIILSPILILIGIGLAFYAIVKRPKNDEPIFLVDKAKKSNKKTAKA